MTDPRPARVAYQGVPGAFSEEAALGFAPGGQAVGFPTFEEAFAAAADGTCDYACLPVENSLAGSINQTYDLLTDSVMNVVGERIVRVHHNLLVKPGVKLEEVRRVYSHPQALAQCMGFIRKHGLEAVTDFDTAGAAKLLAENGGEGKAAIASLRAAQEYGLEVVAEKIEDLPFNFTRFFVLGYADARAKSARPPGDETRYKTSLVVATRHRPGDLVTCLEVFPLHEINMTKLESRPRRDKPWSYLFYIDIDGHIEEPNVAAAMADLMRRAAFVKYLGSYAAADPVEVS
ncbi:MAG: prephenate dehydratase [Trueperaceae bacterium]|jgi:prephenate dehydratase|nr:prephenate dehydratase [Truepera sp.]HRN18060.1 prephenate dehydratase [Trueperaceae bacterium]HRQ10593.1 prephenate dehydratase [Trueperaceae bacterium]